MNDEYDPNLVVRFFKEYQDRGMMKWQGFYLSDHTVAVAKKYQIEDELINYVRNREMNELEISKTIAEAIKKQVIVTVELKDLDNNRIVPTPVSGHILSYDNKGMYLENDYVAFSKIHSIKMN
ncbi:hypothetical protein Q2T76_00380 [Lactobacillus sp. YT155]|uniref:hypothetical protein n=1 Tax=Lactobacillus sp. YT155 TaxID=3060955 RepID=UPI00265F107D|nr:hypothetical protein [Lactobacillus sp. YT155]MDO1604504.1 hypothetical protein [Lactobacillus sp. YT155]